MGWSISCDVNTLRIPEECGNELEGLNLDLDSYSPELGFVDDHMEHMDPFRGEHSDAIMDILARYKVNGQVCFSSSDGDDRGKKWGYEWNNGVVKHLKGSTSWVEAEDESDDPDPLALKQLILMTVDDLVADFLYYNRKEDEDLPQGSIEAAIEDGVISIDEIIAMFTEKLTEGVKS